MSAKPDLVLLDPETIRMPGIEKNAQDVESGQTVKEPRGTPGTGRASGMFDNTGCLSDRGFPSGFGVSSLMSLS